MEFVLSCWKYFKRSIIEMGPGSDPRYRLKSIQDKAHSILGTWLWNGSLKVLMKDLFVCVVNKTFATFRCGIFSSIFHLSCFSLYDSWVFTVWSSNLGTVFQLERHQHWKESNSYHHCLYITFLSSLKIIFSNHTELYYWLMLWTATSPAYWVPLFVWEHLLLVLWAHHAHV